MRQEQFAQQLPENRLQVGRVALLWLALAGWGISPAIVRAVQPGELFELSLPDAKPAQTLRFHYCPPGTIRPGRPAREGGSASEVVPPTPMRGFYLAETEITLGQFRAVLGEAGAAPLKQEAAKYQAMNPQLFALIQKGEHEPVFFVGLAGAVQFCLRVQSSADEARAKQAVPSLESRRIRLPSHVEWQYGARAIADANQESRLPHFNREFRFAEL